MKKKLLSLLAMLACCLPKALACYDLPNYVSGCMTINADGSETINITYDELCWSAGASSSATIYLFICTTGTYGSSAGDYITVAGTTIVSSSSATFTYTIPASQALSDHQCYTAYYAGDMASAPWLPGTSPPSFQLCGCPTGGCYAPDSTGMLVLKLTTPAAGPSPMYVWIEDLLGMGYGPDGPYYENPGSPVADPDGVDYDHLFTFTGYSDTMLHDTCITVYYNNSGSLDDGVNTYRICPCPTAPLGGCVTIGSTGNLDIKLTFPSYLHTLDGNNIYLWITTGSGATPYLPVSVIADGSDWDYDYSLPYMKTDSCFTIYYSSSPYGPSQDKNPADFAQTYVVCPCCNSGIEAIIMTSGPWDEVTFKVGQPSAWTFSDGGTASGSEVTHTFTGSGPYVACATSTNADGSICSMCDTVCLDSVQSGHGHGFFGSGPLCDPDFAIIMNGNTITVWPGPNPFFVSPSGTFYWSWGDGTTTYGVGGIDETHVYPTAGAYNICVTRVITTPAGKLDSCTMCYNICLLNNAPPPPVPDTFNTLGGCYDVSGNTLRLKLVFSASVHAMAGSGIYAWDQSGSGVTAYLPTSIVPDADGTDWDYMYTMTVPAGGISGCYTIYYSADKYGFAHDTNPADFARSALICPCCTGNLQEIMYAGTPGNTVTLNAGQPSAWTFSDGTNATGTEVTHTFTGTGPYIACASSTNADGSKCEMCDTLCFPENPDKSIVGSPAGCYSGFAVIIDHNTVTTWPGPDPFYISPSGTFYWSWGDGTTTFGVGGSPQTHTYLTPGTYNICVTRVMNYKGQIDSCSTCYSICIAYGTTLVESGCYDITGANLSVKMVFNDIDHSLYGNNIYVWPSATSGPILPVSVSHDADGTDWDYMYTIPISAIPGYRRDSCVTLYYYNEPSGPNNDKHPADFASTYVICPCCSKPMSASYTVGTMYGGPTTVNFSATQVSTWDFGDGSTGSGISVSHTYGAPGTYIVCASSTNADGSICKQCDTICLSNTSDSLVEGGGGGITKGGHGGWGFVCDADFAVVVTGNSIVGWPGPDPFFVSPSGVFVWTWGDGTVTSGVGGTPEPHTYPGPGTYTICLQRTMYNSEGDTLVCSKCFTICIASGGNGGNDARHMSPSGVTPVTIYSDGIQLAPNPATDMTTLTLSLEQPSGVKVIMSDEVGHIISYVVNEQLVAGMHQFDIPTGKLLPGIYYIKIETAAGITVKRLSVLK